MTTRRKLIVSAAALAAGMGWDTASAQALAGPPLIEAFYAPPATADTALSPNGKRVAVLRNRADPKGFTESFIEIVEVEQPGAPRKIVRLGRQEASQVVWATDSRFLVWIVYDVTHKGYPTEKIVRMISLDEDSGLAAVMFGNSGEEIRWIHNLGNVVDMLPDDPDHILMAAMEARRGLPALFIVDVRTGRAGRLEYGAPGTLTWHTQNGIAMMRLDADGRGAGVRVMARAPGEKDWKLVRIMRSDQVSDFEVLGPTTRDRVFLCIARQPGEDKVSIREIELASLTIGPPLNRPRPVDADGVWQDVRGNLLAYRWRDDRVRYEVVDPAVAPHLAAIQAKIDPELNINMREVDDARQRYLLAVYGPREPGLFLLYDGVTGKLSELGRVQPDLTPARLGQTKVMSVRTRDGAAFPAYLTQPASGAPGPLIVMPHGGPEARDDYGFDTWAQVMAAQGWWVLQPNFRGSGGFGAAFAQSGWRRWGERMQEDLEDAVAQAIAEHRLDVARVAIVGASYGGYAAQMGAVRRPDLYKAVVSLAGVSDLTAMLKWERQEDATAEKAQYAFWRSRIGDPEMDAQMLARASPRQRVQEIKAPVLLIHGDDDGTVPVEQSRDMVKALKAAGKSVEYLELKRVGHSPASPKADRETLSRVIAFLTPYLV